MTDVARLGHIERSEPLLPLSVQFKTAAIGVAHSGGVGLAAMMRDEWVPLAEQLEGAVEELLTFAHTVLDTPCPYGREGDPWAAVQRRASELITKYGGQR
jgi:hypothetical protein